MAPQRPLALRIKQSSTYGRAAPLFPTLPGNRLWEPGLIDKRQQGRCPALPDRLTALSSVRDHHGSNAGMDAGHHRTLRQAQLTRRHGTFMSPERTAGPCTQGLGHCKPKAWTGRPSSARDPRRAEWRVFCTKRVIRGQGPWAGSSGCVAARYHLDNDRHAARASQLFQARGHPERRSIIIRSRRRTGGQIEGEIFNLGTLTAIDTKSIQAARCCRWLRKAITACLGTFPGVTADRRQR